MRTAIISEENNFQYRTILDMSVRKGETNNCIEIWFVFKDKEIFSSSWITFFIDYTQGSKLRNIQDEYNLSEKEIISFIFKKNNGLYTQMYKGE